MTHHHGFDSLDVQELFSVPLRLVDGVWSPAAGEGSIGYGSDSFARETLLDIVRGADDLGSLSAELEQQAGSWPARYYLSAARTNLLRPFAWDADATVLEVGSGCGTMTRFLGETFRRVVAVEGEMHRARVGASRSRDQPNVSVVCADYADLAPLAQFDLVFCIGVLEYAPLFVDSAHPALTALESFRKHLRPGGSLVVAIENKLGLKYFTGAAEDHTGLRYDGVEGYHRSGGRGPRTFGRAELADLLEAAGFDDVRFWYPFPDYKFPKVIASEEALSSDDPQVPEFIGGPVAGDYLPGGWIPTFNQRATWHELVKNRIAVDLANSFLVVASDGPADRALAEWDLASFHIGDRKPEFWNATLVSDLGGPEPTIGRKRLFDDRSSARLSMPDEMRDEWLQAPTLGQLASRAALARNASPASIAGTLLPWVDHLRSLTDAEGRLPGRFVDAIPQNLVTTENGIVLIDQEWHWHAPVDLSLLVSRGLAALFQDLHRGGGLRGSLRRRSIARLMIATARSLGLDYGPRDVRDYLRFEREFQTEVTGRGLVPRRFGAELVVPGVLQPRRRSYWKARVRSGLSRLRRR